MVARMKIYPVLVLLMACPLSVAACDNKADDPVSVVQAQVDAYNAHDVAKFASCYADDVVITDLGGQRPVVVGAAALKQAYAFLATKPKEFRVEITRRVVNGPVVVDQEQVMGLPADKGQPKALAVYEVREGKIRKVWFPPRD
ncbi:nuclear transport factor 2 family protein [Dyella sp. EPa41]|uniref:nuclear transport factor 2 family protein n=1 Tax=Dyella sp. EPa41 TaxID=1561194 RepID=UPI0019156679|nr:nuclear transport factor 2 family protein [Dyella sp. EPa41]